MSDGSNTETEVLNGDAGQADGPVTVSIARRVQAGHEAEYEAWVSGISQTAAQFPGHLSVAVLRPSAATRGDYVIIYRFDSYEHCRVWEESRERAEWVERLADIVEGDSSVKRVTGLEFWFDLPEVPAAAAPSQHKMALVLVVVVYLILVGLNWALAPLISDLPSLVRTFIIVVLQVGLLTYLVMPRVTRLLRPWLFRR
ncbi:MAG: antibiotic biosynthesis monooxygenase [Hyphomicrobiales bacterium]|nr:MAG: antibiotic biosynthesis monooxygenase [Hyphomicrobiales bacterium]